MRFTSTLIIDRGVIIKDKKGLLSGEVLSIKPNLSLIIYEEKDMEFKFCSRATVLYLDDVKSSEDVKRWVLDRISKQRYEVT